MEKFIELSRAYGRHIFGLFGVVLTAVEPTIPIATICTVCVLLDCYTAWALSRRVKKKYPGANDGKFKSNYAGRVFVTLLKIYTVLVLVHFIQIHITDAFFVIELPKLVAGAFCFYQIWSMLENESSCNDARWARIAQKILIDKTERHFDIDLSDLKNNKRKEEGENGERI